MIEKRPKGCTLIKQNDPQIKDWKMGLDENRTVGRGAVARTMLCCAKATCDQLADCPNNR